MKAINLAITNADSLPDGGPMSFSSDGRSFEIGRDTHRDWTLPDQQLFISGRHCEVSFDGSDWILVDVSRNGTFVNGSRQRIKSPYRLQDGDTLSIGNYQVAVKVQEARQSPAPRASGGVSGFTGGDAWGSTPARAVPDEDDIWGSVSPGPAPANRRDFMPKRQQPAAEADFVRSHIDMPAAAGPARRKAGTWGDEPDPAQPVRVPMPAPGAPMPQADSPFDGGGTAESPAMAPSPPPPARGGDMLGGFKLGARLPSHVLSNRDSAELSQEIGAIMLLVTEQMAQLLRARASAKSMVGAKNRTFIQAMDNNPLKFMADPSEALESMLSKGRSGYLDGMRAFREAFDDLKAHEMATYAAMQKALARLLDDLSPEAIESRTEKSMLSNSKAKAWDTFVQRWEAKTEAHDNGMLDVFLLYFSEAYQEAEGKRRR